MGENSIIPKLIPRGRSERPLRIGALIQITRAGGQGYYLSTSIYSKIDQALQLSAVMLDLGVVINYSL
jgi:hypothetical protein